MKWEDITRLGYSPTAKWLRLETRNGRVVRMSIMLNGLRGFARAVLARVPVDRIDPPAQTLLQSAVRGLFPRCGAEPSDWDLGSRRERLQIPPFGRIDRPASTAKVQPE